MSDITWTNCERTLGELVKLEWNPKQLKEANAKRLSGSRKKFGQTHVFLIGPDYDEGGEASSLPSTGFFALAAFRRISVQASRRALISAS